MTDPVTRSVRARLGRHGCEPCPQSLYEGEGADFYELLVGSDRSEVREVLRLARRAAGDVLDLAAGGGRLTIPLLRAGAAVTALDLSADMLAHLRVAAGPEAELVVRLGDMTAFDLGQRFGLIVLGATSISLLDADGRRGLYSSVARHLAPRGIFAFSTAADDAMAALSAPADRVIAVEGPDGPEEVLFSQEASPSGAERTVNFLRVGELRDGGAVRVFTSTLHVLAPGALAAELRAAGFAEPERQEVRRAGGSPATASVILSTTLAGAV